MVKKIAEGATRYDEHHWAHWTNKELRCPKCGGTFELENRDFEGQEVGANYDEPTFRVTLTQRHMGGEQHIAGACPWCKEGITFVGNNQTGPDAVNRTVDRASLPPQTAGFRWYQKYQAGVRNRPIVLAVALDGTQAAIPLQQADGNQTLYHAVGRREGQIVTDMTVALDAGWSTTAEVEAGRSDHELVDFVNRLGLAKPVTHIGRAG